MEIAAHQILLVFVLVWGALSASGVWEAYAEGRNAWDKGKVGWSVRVGSFTLTGYHFFLFVVTYPLLLTLPFVFTGWNPKLFGVIVSAYASGLVIEDIVWYAANPAVRFNEWFTSFSDYYPWIRIRGNKIIPVLHVTGIVIALASWLFIWR